MRVKNKFVIAGLSAIFFVSSFKIVHAEELNETKSTTGLQLTFDVGVSGEFGPKTEYTGRIKINKNHLKIDGKPLSQDNYYNSPYFGPLALPMINTGYLMEYDPYLAYMLNLSPEEMLDEQKYEPGFFWPPSMYSDGGYRINILPPLAVNYERTFPSHYAEFEIPGLGIMTSSFLPEGSVKKVDKNLFSINFDTCELEDFYGDICGIIDVIIEGNGDHISRFEGKRTDRFGKLKLVYEGKFIDKTASVKGTIFGETLHPYLNAVYSYHELSNVIKERN